jgi:hypothetical protein
MSDDFLDPDPALDDVLIARLINDIAIDIHEIPDIARRYGFADKAALRRYMKRHPKIMAEAMRARALYSSDESAETRARMKATQATERLIATTYHIALNERIAPQQRIDAFKQLSRVSGLDNSAAAAAKNANGGGPGFTLNILFRDKPAEKINLVDNTPHSPLTINSEISEAIEVEGDDNDS